LNSRRCLLIPLKRKSEFFPARPTIVQIIALEISLMFSVQFQVMEKCTPFGGISHACMLRAADALNVYLF
jgi:hypothetical protein